MKIKFTYLFCFICVFSMNIKAQTVSSFENLNLPLDTFRDGRKMPDWVYDYRSGNVLFESVYDTSWGGNWVDGIAASNMRDSIHTGYTNIYSSANFKGNNSKTYGVGKSGSEIVLTGLASKKQVSGMYVNNSFYAWGSMKSGDMFAKKFGGVSGNDPDWFLLTATGIIDTVEKTQKAYFYLADFRFSDNSKDYIINQWSWFDLSVLGDVDRIRFDLSSSDSGTYGYNTPLYFCMDDIKTFDKKTGIKESINNAFTIFPNPATDNIYLPIENGKLYFSDMQGRMNELMVQNHVANISNLNKGLYIIRIYEEEKWKSTRLIIE